MGMIGKSLNELFESAPKVRILKLFLRNPDENFDLAEVARRSQISKGQCRRHIQKFISIGLVRAVSPTQNAKKAKKKKSGKKKNPRR